MGWTTRQKNLSTWCCGFLTLPSLFPSETLLSRWLSTLDVSTIHSLEEFNRLLADYIRRQNTTVHSGTGETPVDSFIRTKDHVRIPKSQEFFYLRHCED